MPGRITRFACACTVAFATLATGSAAQEQTAVTRRDTYWLGVGLGVGSEGLGGQLNTSYQSGANLISFRVASTAGLFEDEVTDYALLYGRATRADRARSFGGLNVSVQLGRLR